VPAAIPKEIPQLCVCLEVFARSVCAVPICLLPSPGSKAKVARRDFPFGTSINGIANMLRVENQCLLE
jgi:hypothetical protein